MRRIRIGLLGALLAVGVTGCGGSALTVPDPAQPSRSGPIATWGKPAGGAPARALLILIHGGGWVGIDRSAFDQTLQMARLMQRLGFETMTVDYRHGAQGIKDVAAFYRQARARVGPHFPICAYGPSAGGHISLMLAVQFPDLACVLDLAGPTDLPGLKRDPHGAAAYRIAVHAFGPSELTQLSPARHAGSIKARLMLVYAANDPLVPVSQGETMARADPNAQLIVLPPGGADFVHTGVGVPVRDSGVSLAARQNAQSAEVSFLQSAKTPS